MEAKYTDLSMALRAAIPLLEVFKSIINGLSYLNKYAINFKATVHEDDQGALILGQLEPGRYTRQYPNFMPYGCTGSVIGLKLQI